MQEDAAKIFDVAHNSKVTLEDLFLLAHLETLYPNADDVMYRERFAALTANDTRSESEAHAIYDEIAQYLKECSKYWKTNVQIHAKTMGDHIPGYVQGSRIWPTNHNALHHFQHILQAAYDVTSAIELAGKTVAHTPKGFKIFRVDSFAVEGERDHSVQVLPVRSDIEDIIDAIENPWPEIPTPAPPHQPFTLHGPEFSGPPTGDKVSVLELDPRKGCEFLLRLKPRIIKIKANLPTPGQIDSLPVTDAMAAYAAKLLGKARFSRANLQELLAEPVRKRLATKKAAAAKAAATPP
ncbi:MAG: hypothetical protein SFW62_03730 [Alphaproteobacteria bacterium]|nr:hypothetical protein [Alphaproteobacteria bacterium]